MNWPYLKKGEHELKLHIALLSNVYCPTSNVYCPTSTVHLTICSIVDRDLQTGTLDTKRFPGVGKVLQPRQKSVPLRLILVVPLIVQNLTAVALTGYFSVQNGQRAINQLVTELQSEISDRVAQHLDTYLTNPNQVNQMNLRAIELGLVDLKNLPQLGQYFCSQMQVNPNFSYINFASPIGEYMGIERTKTGEILLNETLKSDLKKLSVYEVDRQGNRTKPQKLSRDPADLEIESWYSDTVKAKRPMWSQIYQWGDQPNILSISSSYPVYDAKKRLLGAIGIDLTLSQIDRFLRELKIGSSGRTFILERDGNLVASSSQQPSDKVVKGKAQRLSAFQSQDAIIRSTTQILIQRFGSLKSIQGGQQFTIDVNGQKTFLKVDVWQDSLGLDWLTVVAVPESDFTEQINENARITFLLCVVASAIATLLGIATSHWIERSIRHLNQASQSVSDGQYEPIAEPGIRELGTLTRSFNRMTEQLKTSFETLEKTNAELEDRVDERTERLSSTLYSLQKAQAQMIQTEKMSSLGQMVAGVAHEINNPVSFIYGNLTYANEYIYELLTILQLYQKHYPNPANEIQEQLIDSDFEFIVEDLRRLFKSMQDGAERIQAIVLSLRNFSRLDESQIKVVNLHEGLESTLLLLQHRLKTTVSRSKIEVIKEYGDLPKVECYPGHLNQVFMSILNNAIDALEESMTQLKAVRETSFDAFPPTIWICTEAINANWVMIRIWDNAVGMTPETLSKMFDPFFTTKPIGKGTGLGLSISYQIVVAQHNGSLSGRSELGKGTEFAIEIPTKQVRM